MKIPTIGDSAAFRAWLYFSIPFLASSSKQVKIYADQHTYPTPLDWFVIVATALIPSLVAVRAYYDGSVKTLKDEKDAKVDKVPDSVTKVP